MREGVSDQQEAISPKARLLPGFFGAGFECSTFIRRSGQRFDLIEATRHDRFAQLDYLRLQKHGLSFAREGVRWHLVERKAGHYDFSSVLPIVRAARCTGTQVIWDLCHFGWPDGLDLFSPEFIERLAAYGAAFAHWLANEVSEPNLFVPVNEISFFSWASGDEGSLHPFITNRGYELKCHLVRATIATMDSILEVSPSARFVHVDPVIHVLPHPRHPEEAQDAEACRLAQFQAWDMIGGRTAPDLSGRESCLDIIGVNYYPQNQWFYNIKGCQAVRQFKFLSRRHRQYRPFRNILAEVWNRYKRPILIAETGAEDRRRTGWFRYVCEEAEAAMGAGIDVLGICLYPVLNHPGWVDDRHCCNGLWDYPDEHGNREIYNPLAVELGHWRRHFSQATRAHPSLVATPVAD